MKRLSGVLKLVVITSLVVMVAGCGTTGSDTSQAGHSDSAQVDSDLTDVVESIRTADEHIESEKVKNNQRVGLALTDPAPIYRGEQVTVDDDETTHQLRVILREQRSKREIPGSDVHVRFLDRAGDELGQTQLPETWGPYLFYGNNVTIPDNTARISVTVAPSKQGRHAEMKDLSSNTFSVSFDVEDNQGWTIAGPEPAPAPDEYALGHDVEEALEEPLELKETGPYKIGLIAEHSEPFWIPHDHAGRAHMHMADIPGNANRHMEIVLLDRETNRIIPHADITLEMDPENEGDVIETKLPFLLAAFNHYGNSLHVPQGPYQVRATIERPRINHLSKDAFPESVEVEYDWLNKEEAEEEEEHEEEA